MLKEAPVKLPEVPEPEGVDNNRKEKSGNAKTSKKEATAANKCTTFVLEKKSVLSEGSVNEDKVTRRTARNPRREMFSITNESDKEKASENTLKLKVWYLLALT